MEKKKIRRLKNIRPEEVSWVDDPANLRPFLFWKRDDDGEYQLDLSVSTDGSIEQTKIDVNGETIEGLVELSLNLCKNPYDKRVALYCSYVQEDGEKDGFQVYRRQVLEKNCERKCPKPNSISETEREKPDAEDLKVLKSLCPDLSENSDADLVKSLAEPVRKIAEYVDVMPPDLKEAIGQLIKLAAETEVGDEKVTDEKKEETPKETVVPKLTDDDLNAIAAKISESLKTVVKETVDGVLAERESKEEEKPASTDTDVELSPEEVSALLEAAGQEVLSEMEST